MRTNASGYLFSSVNDLCYLVIMLSVVSMLVSLHEVSNVYVRRWPWKQVLLRAYVCLRIETLIIIFKDYPAQNSFQTA